jgi:hypothetical protein
MSGVTGEQLHDQVRAAAQASGQSIKAFVRPLFGDSSWKLEQLRIAKTPTQSTIDRVRALIAGEPLPAAPVSPRKGLPLGKVRKVSDGEHRLTGDEIARRRSLTYLAHHTRRPGETLHAAIRRLTIGGAE